MAEFAAAALAALGTTGATAAGTTAAATTAAAATAATTSAISWTSIGSLLSTALAGGSALMGAMAASRAGEAEAARYRMQAADAEVDAKTEDINGMQRQDSLRRQLLQAVGEHDVAYAASGLDLTFGTPETARNEADTAAARAISDDQNTTQMRKQRLKERAASFQSMALESKSAADMKGYGLLLETGGRALRRG